MPDSDVCAPGEPQIPEWLDALGEIDVKAEPDEFGVQITIVWGECSIVIEHSPEGAAIVPWLLQAMPAILERVEEQLNQEDTP